mmetsp:Transcript_48588/g.72100  ORF Transcript_48588/g.72100 Transcript_48588/m.72100 type:complete len:556 (-) Transcript_48588:787-2454(-)
MANGNDANDRGVCLVECTTQSCRQSLRLLVRNRFREHLQPTLDARVDLVFYGLDLAIRQGFVVLKVESQSLGVVVGTLLVALLSENLTQSPVEHVGHRVIGRDKRSAVVIHDARNFSAAGQLAGFKAAHVEHISREFHDLLHVEAHFRLPNGDVELVAGGCFSVDTQIGDDGPGVKDLTTGFGIERRGVEDKADNRVRTGDLVHVLDATTLSWHENATKSGIVDFEPVVLRFLVRGGHTASRQVQCLLLLQRKIKALFDAGVAAAFLLLVHGRRVPGLVGRETFLLGHKLCKIERKAICIVELESNIAGEDLGALRLQVIKVLLEKPSPASERASECVLLVSDNFLDVFDTRTQFGESLTEHLVHNWDQLDEESWFALQNLLAVTNGAAQNAAEDVVAPVVAGDSTIGDRESQSSDVVGQHTVSHVDVSDVLGTNLALVHRDTLAAQSFDRAEDASENVGVVVGAKVLQDRRDALETHASVDRLRGQRVERRVGQAVELDEHNVPNLQDIGVIHVDQFRDLAVTDTVVVKFGAGTARASGSHFPEVILLVERDNV